MEEIQSAITEMVVNNCIYSVLDTPQKARLWVQAQYLRLEPKRQQWKQCEASIENAPPFVDSELRAMGINYMTNKNYGELRNVCSPVERSFFKTWSKVKNLISCRINAVAEKTNAQLPNVPNTMRWEKILAYAFSEAIRADRSFKEKVQAKGIYITRYGTCLMLQKDKKSYHIDTIHPTRVILPEYAKNDVDDWSSVGIIEHYDPEHLWRMLESDTALANGWNEEALKMLLYMSSSFGRGATMENWGNNVWDPFYLTINQTAGGVGLFYDREIELVRVAARNKDGKIDEALLSREYQACTEFIYKKENKHEKFSDFVFLFTIKPGVEYFDQNFGVAEEAFELADAITQADCKTNDQVGWNGTVFIKGSTGINNPEDQTITPGTINILPTGAELEQGGFANQLTATANTTQLLRSQLYAGLGLAGYNPVQPDDERGKDDNAALTGETLKDYLSHHYEQLDFFWRWVFKNLLDTKKGMPGYENLEFFREELLVLGFPLELIDTKEKNVYGLPKFIRMTASRVLGTGSAIADSGYSQRLISMSGLLGPTGRRNITEAAIMQEVGPDHYDLAYPPQDQQGVQDHTDIEIADDINWFTLGKTMPAIQIQDHIKHCSAKLQFLGQIRQAVESNQFNPAQFDKPYEEPVVVAFMIMNPAIRNIQEHLQFLQQDANYKTEATEIAIGYGALVNFVRKIEAAAQSSLAAQAKKVERLSDKEQMAAREDAVLQAGEKRKDIALVGDEKRKDAQTLNDIRTKQTKAAADIKITSLSSYGKIANQRQADIMKAVTETGKTKPAA